MKRLPFTPKNQAANSSDFLPVSICFADQTVNALFAQLLEARGVHTHICACTEELRYSNLAITEPQYYSYLNTDKRQHCLVVGSKESLADLDTLILTQPLTEDKIETALHDFLAQKQ